MTKKYSAACRILGVSEISTLKEIRAAHRVLAKKWHPDKFQGDDRKKAEEKIKYINNARDTVYAHFASRPEHENRAEPHSAPPRPPSPRPPSAANRPTPCSDSSNSANQHSESEVKGAPPSSPTPKQAAWTIACISFFVIVAVIYFLVPKEVGNAAAGTSQTSIGSSAYGENEVPAATPHLPSHVSKFLGNRGLAVPTSVSKYCRVSGKSPYVAQGDFDGDAKPDYAVEAFRQGGGDGIFVFFATGVVFQIKEGWDVIFEDRRRGVTPIMEGTVNLKTDSFGAARCESSSVLFVYNAKKRGFDSYFTSD